MGPAPAIGIDLGTTFSSAAVYRNGKSEVIPNKDGHRLTPSLIFYHPDGLDVSVGKNADFMGIRKINNLLFDIKRLIGRKYDDVYVQKLIDSKEYRFKIIKGDDEKVEIELTHDNEKVCKSPEQASSEILKYLRESASEYLGAEVTEAVISVPAHFSNAQRKATRAAAELAGLNVLKLLTEPVAAAIHYAQDRLNTQGTLLVFDFGGGTLDVSIIEVDNHKFKVKSVEGDTFLGGRDFDEILFRHFKDYLIKSFGTEIFTTRVSDRIKKNCNRLKIILSTKDKYFLPLDLIDNFKEKKVDRDVTFPLTRSDFEKLGESLFKRAQNLVETCIKEAGISKENIDEVVLVGGSTRIPKVREMLSSFFGNQKIHTDLNPDEAVALGAAIQAALIKDKYQELEKYKITEVTPLSIGIAVSATLMNVIIKKNTSLPFKSRPITCVTTNNDQKNILIEILEGEKKNCKFNNFLASLEISNLPPGRAGTVEIEEIYSLNEDGILEVKVTVKGTGQKNNLVVTIGEFRLCDYKIRHAIEDAERNRQEDDIFEEFVLYKEAVRDVYNNITYDLDKISSDIDRNFVKQKCEELKNTIENLEYKQFNDLRKEYAAFKNAVKKIIENQINVVFFYPGKNFIYKTC